MLKMITQAMLIWIVVYLMVQCRVPNLIFPEYANDMPNVIAYELQGIGPHVRHEVAYVISCILFIIQSYVTYLGHTGKEAETRRSSTVDIILKLLSRKLSIVLSG